MVVVEVVMVLAGGDGGDGNGLRVVVVMKFEVVGYAWSRLLLVVVEVVKERMAGIKKVNVVLG